MSDVVAAYWRQRIRDLQARLDRYDQLHGAVDYSANDSPKPADECLAEIRRLLADFDIEPAGRGRLCALADDDGRGAHWLAPGEQCPAARRQG